jgi:GT2 family glycosyltransferase
VIVSTYEAPAYLERVLIGLACQSAPGFEVVVADDGSGPDTRRLLERMRASFAGGLRHVWHEDRGFQKSEILNRAIGAAAHPYLVFTDGDCVPRADFVAVHAARARPASFLSGGYVKLPARLSADVDAEAVRSARCFDPAWLRARGLRDLHALAKLRAGRAARILEVLTPTRPSWNGHNASGWKADLVRVNGFDERMQYGGQDRELGERLVHAGIRPIQVRYSAITLHLDHARGYKTDASIERNRAIRAETRAKRATWTEFGIARGPERPL